MSFRRTINLYSTISGRRFATDLRDAKAGGYLASLPHYNSVFQSVHELGIETNFEAGMTGTA